jgi:hypothetical protein
MDYGTGKLNEKRVPITGTPFFTFCELRGQLIILLQILLF